jgi:hypothetical protein
MWPLPFTLKKCLEASKRRITKTQIFHYAKNTPNLQKNLLKKQKKTKILQDIIIITL